MSDLQPPSIAVIGPTGTGKTYSIVTLLLAGLDVYFIGTEPGAPEVILDAIQKAKPDLINKFHYHQMNVVAQGWDALEMTARLVRDSSYKTLSEMSGISKEKMQSWMDFLHVLKDFPDDRTGTKLGDVTLLPPTAALVIDSLSGLNKMAREYTVGYKPTLHQGEWGTAMQLEENVIYKLISDRKCFFVLIAHVDREIDEVLGGTTITMAALGRKLGPQLVKYFSEVIYAKFESKQFFWSTDDAGVNTKTRTLGFSNRLPPDFRPIVEAYQRRVASTITFPRRSQGA